MADKKKQQGGKKPAPKKKSELSMDDLKKVSGGVKRRGIKKTP